MSMNRFGDSLKKNPWLCAGATACLLAVLLAPSARAENKEGEAKLQEATGFDVEKKALKIELGDKVKASCACHIDPDNFKKKVVSVYANVRNTTDKDMYFGLYVAFFDKDKKLIGCASSAGRLFSPRCRPRVSPRPRNTWSCRPR